MNIKNNKKGFMMAEVIVVSAIVVTALTTLFMSYNKVYMIYKSRISYYDSVTLYRLAYYRDILIEKNLIETKLDNAKNSSTNIITIYNSYSQSGSGILSHDEKVDDVDNDNVLLIYNNKEDLPANILTTGNQTFKDYINYLSTSTDFKDTNYVMVMERCSQINENDCKYAYLKIYDGYE